MTALPVPDDLNFDGWVFQPATRRVFVGGQATGIGARAYDLLAALIERRDRVVSKNELFDIVWPGLVVEENNLMVQVSTLRKLLGPQTITTVPGRGYRFTAMEVNSATRVAPSRAVSPNDSSLTNLPEALPNLIGRDNDVQAVRALLQTHRFVSLVGAGGIGKTRLALAVAHAERHRWPDGVWVIEFAPLSDSSLVAVAIAQVLGVKLPGRKVAAEELADVVRTKNLLLVLDNCEHLLAAAEALVATIIAQAPAVKILTTSQEPLRVVEGQQFRVPPLHVPSEAHASNMRDFGALTLFEARAQAADPRFQLDKGNVTAVAEICRRLDGLPLAIELAAARVPLLGVEGVRSRLDDRFRVLTSGTHVGPQRQQTLRATMEWSYSLLNGDEQVVLRRLSVFAGSFDLRSAQRVAGDERIDEWVVLDMLGTLVDKSFVTAGSGSEPRYRLQENGRAWAAEKLIGTDESTRVQQRHAQAVLEAFERSAAERWSLPVSARLERYLPDVENLRAAIKWASSAESDSDLQVALVGAAGWIWNILGHRREGIEQCEQAMSRITTSTSRENEARLLGSWLDLVLPRCGAAECAASARVVELYRQVGDRQWLYASLCVLGYCQARVAKSNDAESLLEEAAVLYDISWPPTLRWPLLFGRALLRSMQGRYEEMHAMCKESLDLAIALDNKDQILAEFGNLVQSSSLLGRLEEAVMYGRELVARTERERFVADVAGVALGQLSMALTRLGQVDEALELARRGLPHLLQTDMLVYFLDPFALLAMKRGRMSAAARTLGRAESAYGERNEVREPNDQHVRDELMAGLCEVLPDTELARLMRDGSALTDEQAARLALS